MSEQIGFLEIRRCGNAIYPHFSGDRITSNDVRKIKQAYLDLKESKQPYCIVVPIPKEHQRLTRLCRLIGLKYWYQTPCSFVWGDWRGD